MENKEEDPALDALAGETETGTTNKENVEIRPGRHDADSGNDGSTNEMLQKEIRIDPGNEHHHRTDADDKIFDEDIDRSPRYDADAGNDKTGTKPPS